MKIVIAMDSFKESMTAKEACEAAKRGIKKACKNADIMLIPMADGGEGTVQALVDASNGKLFKEIVTGPLGETVEGFFGILGNSETAVIEMASASGLELVPHENRNPLITTTRGTGELILKALDKGVKKIIMGIGGSATNDGGVGMAQALGVRFLTENNSKEITGGGDLQKIIEIDVSGIDPRIKETEFLIACDVSNPLTGEQGASAVFGPQKGATLEMVEILDSGLKNLALNIKNSLNIDVENIPGAGAAGGLGAGSIAFLNARLQKGVDIVIDCVGLNEKMQGADFVITGEGRIDGQSIFGKTPIGVAKIAKENGAFVIGLAGSLGEGYEKVYDSGIDCAFSIVNGICDLEKALANGAENLEKTAYNIGKLLNFK